MSASRPAARILAALAALGALAASPALASGGGGGGGGACAPLATKVRLAHSDGTGNSAIGVETTVRNCGAAPEPLELTVSVPGSGTVPFRFSTGVPVQPGFSLTLNASPIGSTPLQLHYGQSYDVVGTLTGAGTTLATITTRVTMPTGVVA